jgi:hypothetical protein
MRFNTALPLYRNALVGGVVRQYQYERIDAKEIW